MSVSCLQTGSTAVVSTALAPSIDDVSFANFSTGALALTDLVPLHVAHNGADNKAEIALQQRFSIDKTFTEDEEDVPLDPFIQSLLDNTRAQLDYYDKGAQRKDIEIIQLKSDKLAAESTSNQMHDYARDIESKYSGLLSKLDGVLTERDEWQQQCARKDAEIAWLNQKLKSQKSELERSTESMLQDDHAALQQLLEEKHEADDANRSTIAQQAAQIAELMQKFERERAELKAQVNMMQEEYTRKLDQAPRALTTPTTAKLVAQHQVSAAVHSAFRRICCE